MDISDGDEEMTFTVDRRASEVLILDEVLEVVNKNIISVDDLKELVESRVDTDIIITGSEMNVEVCKFADKISEIGNMQFRNF